MKHNDIGSKPRLLLRTLGGLRLEVEGDVSWEDRKPLLLLVLLADRDGVASREHLATMLWEQAGERRARQSLRQALLWLRRRLGEEVLQADGNLVRLDLARLRVDLLELEEAVRDERDDAALDLYEGELLPGLEDAGGGAFRGWLDAERERVRSLVVLACRRRIGVLEEEGAWNAAADVALTWCEIHSLDEEAHLEASRLLRMAGRPGEGASLAASLAVRLRGDTGDEAPDAVLAAARAGPWPAGGAPGTHERGPDGWRGADPPHPDLVGRRDVLAGATALLERVQSGEGAVLVLDGAPGSGRTRLLDELVRRASDADPRPLILRATGHRGESGPTGAALRDLLPPLASAPGLAGAADRDLALLAGFAPAIRARYPHLPPSPRPVELAAGTENAAGLAPATEAAAGPAADALARSAEALVRVLDDVAVEAPVLVCVDDVDALDAISRGVVLALAHRVPPHVLLVLAGRIPASDPELASVLAMDHASSVVLHPLSRGHVEALLASILTVDPDARAALASRLHEEAGGLPGPVVALTSALVEADVLAPSQGTWTVAPGVLDRPFPIPGDLRRATVAELARLGPEARNALAAAAACGHSVDPARLGELADLDPAETEAAVADLLDLRLLQRKQGGGTFRLAPATPLLGRIVLDAVNPARLQELEGRLSRVAPREPRRWWRRGAAAVAGIAAAGILAAVGWSVSRPAAPAPPRDVVAVLPFLVRGGQDAAYLREGLMDLLSVQLDRIGELRTVDPHAVLGRAGGGGESLRPARARRLARQLGAGSYILGSVLEAGGEIQIQASLYGPGRSPERTARVRGHPQEDLFAMVDRLVRELLPALLPELDDPLDRSAVRTTVSMEALEAYLAGERAFRRGLYPEAADAFRTALAADSAFSLAHYRLAVATEFSGEMDPEVFHHAVDQALRHALGLPWRERAFLEAFALYHRGRAVDAEARFGEVLADYPEDVDALYGLGEVLLHAGPRSGRLHALADARRAFEAVLDLDPAHMESRLHLVRIAAAEADSAAIALHLETLGSGSLEGRPIVESGEVLQAFAAGDAAARREALRRLERQPAILVLIPALFVATYAGDAEGAAGIAALATSPARPARQRAAAHVLRAHLLAALGRLDEAGVELTAAAPLHPALARRHRGLLLAVPDLSPDTTGLDSLRSALAEPTEGEVMGPDDLRYLTLTPGMDRAFDLYVAGLLEAVGGELEGAGSRAAALEALDAPDPRLRDDLARGVRAEILRRRGRPGEALQVLEDIRYETWHQAAMGSPFHALARERFLRAELLRELGRADEAGAWRATRRGTTPWDLVYSRPADARAASTSPNSPSAR